MIVHSATKDYSVELTERLEDVLRLKSEENAFFVIDANVWRLYQGLLGDISREKVFLLEACESKKVIDTALEICECMVSMNAKRNAHLISIGGGITQDISGFAANILYRGIAWTFVPTTLLAACDSCIGGKTSLNYKSYKNLLGTFFPPDKIVICPQFFQTLSKADIESGLGEVVKFNVMAGSESLSEIERSIGELIALEASTVNSFVRKSLDFKRQIIEEDEFDRGRRVLLNFAHTFGHAYEVSSEYAIPHGTAVALGMVAANSISVRRNILQSQIAKRIEGVVKEIVPSIDSRLIDAGVVLEAIRKDKKQIGENLSAVLLASDFDLQVVHDMNEKEVEYSCEYIQRFLEG